MTIFLINLELQTKRVNFKINLKQHFLLMKRQIFAAQFIYNNVFKL